jgi:hypothetical protein
MAKRRHSEDMAFIVVIGILAFFPLAVAFGADSRPHDRRARRWL